tara:strand:- start:544 stop:1518 length:975 start_codon:yes stop_codon:yes gene_type:complete
MKLLFENWRKFLKEEEAIEKLYKALGEDQQKIFKTLTAEQQLNLAMEWSQEGMPGGLLNEAITIDIEVGDIVLGGKYKNKRMTVKEIGKDELGQPTVNGKPILKFRTEKHLPDNKKSKKTLDAEKEKLDEAKVSKSVLKTLRAWPKGWRGGESPGKYYGNFKKSDWTADDKGYIEDKGRGFYVLSDLGREILAANPPEEKVQEQESGLPPGFEGFDVGDEDDERDPDHEALASLDQGDEFIIGRRKQVYRVINKAKDSLTKRVIKVGTRGRNSYMVHRINPEGAEDEFVVAPFKIIRADGTAEKKPAAPPGLITKVGHTEPRDW